MKPHTALLAVTSLVCIVRCVDVPPPAPLAALNGSRCDKLARLENRRQLYKHVRSCAFAPIREVCEVGVWKGGNALTLQQVFRPRRLTLVDPWVETTDPRYVAANEQVVRRKFADSVASGAVVTVKDTSTHWLATQRDGAFDLIYLDTVHSYAQTLAELPLMARVVAPSGFLCGHDFGHPKKKDASPGMEYGVIEATVDFALEQGWELVAVSLRDAPYRSYCLRRL